MLMTNKGLVDLSTVDVCAQMRAEAAFTRVKQSLTEVLNRPLGLLVLENPKLGSVQYILIQTQVWTHSLVCCSIHSHHQPSQLSSKQWCTQTPLGCFMMQHC